MKYYLTGIKNLKVLIFMEISQLIYYADIDNNWITFTLEIREFLVSREQKITTALNLIKKIYDGNDRRVELVRNNYNIFYGHTILL